MRYGATGRCCTLLSGVREWLMVCFVTRGESRYAFEPRLMLNLCNSGVGTVGCCTGQFVVDQPTYFDASFRGRGVVVVVRGGGYSRAIKFCV